VSEKKIKKKCITLHKTKEKMTTIYRGFIIRKFSIKLGKETERGLVKLCLGGG